jgi:hypothetical protein
MRTSHRNGLFVVEDAADFNTIDRQLRVEVDDRLFLTAEYENGGRVYRVLYDRGDDVPAEICRWPHQLSSGLVDLVKSLRPREGPDLERAARANEAKAARDLADFERDVDEIADDVGPRIEGRRSPLFHRGMHLRRARRGG